MSTIPDKACEQRAHPDCPLCHGAGVMFNAPCSAETCCYFATGIDDQSPMMRRLPTKVVDNAFGPKFTLVGIPWERGVAWVNADTPEGRAAILKAGGAA